jgi:hypothetical protein
MVDYSGFTTNFGKAGGISYDLITSQGSVSTTGSGAAITWHYVKVGNLILQYPDVVLPQGQSFVFGITNWTVRCVNLTSAGNNTASAQNVTNSGFKNVNSSDSYCLAWGYENALDNFARDITSNFKSNFGTASTAVDILSNVQRTDTFVGISDFYFIYIGNMLFQLSMPLAANSTVNPTYSFAVAFDTIYGMIATSTSNSRACVKNVNSTSFVLANSNNNANAYCIAWGTRTSLVTANSLVPTYQTKFNGSTTYNVVSNIITTTLGSTGWSCMYVGQLLFQFTANNALMQSGSYTFPIQFNTVYGVLVTSSDNLNTIYVTNLTTSGFTLNNVSSNGAYCFAYGLCNPN